ncbi:MAG: serine hydrolase domain-containing protein [Gemmatimonadales bacterium]
MLTVRATVSRALVALWFCSTPMATQAAAQTGDPSADPDVQAAIRLFSSWIEGQIRYRELPGVAVGVVADQRLVWARGFGLADLASKRPMTPATKFRMASHSKLFTATAIMQLREQGKLQLDDPVVKYLPWFRVKTAAPDDPPITIEELLTHSSGLPREAGAHWTTWEFPTRDQLIQLIPERQAAFSPETRWKYSNLAYTVAGMVIEAVSGESWASYVGKHIFAPLAMTGSSVDRDVPDLATGYSARRPGQDRSVIPFVDARGMAAATGITSSVEDMAKFVSAQFRTGPRGGDRILSTASLREMHRVRMLESTWTRGQGIGFSVSREDGQIYIGHGGGYPGYTTNTSIQLASKVGVIVLTNTNDSDPGDIADQLMSTVGAAVAKATATKPAVVAWNPAWARFAGRYRSAQGSETEVVLLNQRLVLFYPEGRSASNTTGLEPIGDGLFRMVAPTGGGPVGEVVRFVEENGQVVRMITGDSFVERIR